MSLKSLRKRQAQQEKPWNEGGTLHASTLRTWHAASYGNALATCSDWVSAFRSWDGQTTESGGTWRVNLPIESGDDWLKYSLQLLTAITEGTKNTLQTAGHMRTSELAMVSAAKLGWLKVIEPPKEGES